MYLLVFLALLFPSLMPPGPPQPCAAIIVGQMKACADGHAWVRNATGWQDVGALHPEPVLVPTLPER